MKKSLFVVLAIVLSAALVGTVNIAAAQEYAPIGEIEGYPDLLEPRIIETQNSNVICWQGVANQTGGKKIVRLQIFRANGAASDGITTEMINSLNTIRPRVPLSNYPNYWKSYGFTCKPAGWRGFIDYNAVYKEATTPTPAAPAKPAEVAPAVTQPLPKAAPPEAKPAETVKPAAASSEPDLQTQINAIKAQMAKPVAAKPVATPPKKTPPPKAQPSPLTVCQNKVKELDKQLATADKNLAVCKGERDNALADQKTTKDKLSTCETNSKSLQTKAVAYDKVRDSIVKRFGITPSSSLGDDVDQALSMTASSAKAGMWSLTSVIVALVLGLIIGVIGGLFIKKS